MTSCYGKPPVTIGETYVISCIMSIEIEKINELTAEKGDHIFGGSLQNGAKPPAAKDKMQNIYWSI